MATITFGARLKSLRDLRGLTQQQVADALGISQQSYARYESQGRLDHHADLLARLAAALKTTPNKLVGG